MFTKQQKENSKCTKIKAFIFAVAMLLGVTAMTVTAQEAVRSNAEAASIKNFEQTITEQSSIAAQTKTSILPFATIEAQPDTLFTGLFERSTNAKFETPVTETGIVRKGKSTGSLRDWFAKFFSQVRVGAPSEAIAGGFSALVFDVSINGEARRGIAVDYGDFVMYHLTSDKNATADDLTKAAFDRTEMVARAQTDLDPNNKDRCNCVLYVRNNFVSSLPNPLTTATQKLNVINHYFPRVPSAAIHPINSGTFAANWHTSAVRSISIQTDGNLNLTIREANYPTCGIYERTGTPEQLGILGYYDPTYPATSGSRSDTNAPKLDSITNSSVPRGREFEIVANGANFEASNSQIVIFGGWCDAWGKCVIPNSNLRQPTATRLRIPLVMNNPGNYVVYVFNPTTGKTSNGKPIVVTN